MKESNDQTIFAWVYGSAQAQSATASLNVLSGLLATDPSAFSASHNIVQYYPIDHDLPFTMTNNGLSISLRLEGVGNNLLVAKLHCVDTETNAEVGIYLKKIATPMEQYARVRVFEWAPIRQRAQLKLVSLYVKQHHNQIPAYQEINRQQRKIRLLQIVPTKDDSDMKLRLLSADIGVARYTALSYLWGPVLDRTHGVTVNSEQVQIPEKSFTMLQKARSRSMRDLFWTDAICVQRTDRSEWQHQQLLVSEIYQHASQVIVLLEDIDSSIIDKFTEISPFSREFEHANSGTRHFPDTIDDVHLLNNMTAIEAIARHRYSTRLWGVQEFCLAQDIVLQFDTRSIPILTFMRTYSACISVMKMRGLYDSSVFRYIDPFLQFAKVQKQVDAQTKNLHCEGSTPHEPRQNKFEEVLEAFRFHECAHSSDRIYALLRCSDLSIDLNIDCPRSREELLREIIAARGSNLTYSALSILQEALGSILK